ncbi:hypothetical protein [Brevibacillus formosus]|nr:hypothetical protein [Brevibacillus formosus]
MPRPRIKLHNAKDIPATISSNTTTTTFWRRIVYRTKKLSGYTLNFVG